MPAPCFHPGPSAGTGTSALSATEGAPSPGGPAQPWGSCPALGVLPACPHPCSVGTGAVLPGRARQGHAPCTLPAPHLLTKPLGWHCPPSPACPNSIPDVILAVLVNKTHLSAQLAMGSATAADPSQVGFTWLLAPAVVCSSFPRWFYRINEISFCWLASSFCNGFVKH